MGDNLRPADPMSARCSNAPGFFWIKPGDVSFKLPIGKSPKTFRNYSVFLACKSEAWTATTAEKGESYPFARRALIAV